MVELYRLLDLGLAGASLLVLALALRECMKRCNGGENDEHEESEG